MKLNRLGMFSTLRHHMLTSKYTVKTYPKKTDYLKYAFLRNHLNFYRRRGNHQIAELYDFIFFEEILSLNR